MACLPGLARAWLAMPCSTTACTACPRDSDSSASRDGGSAAAYVEAALTGRQGGRHEEEETKLKGGWVVGPTAYRCAAGAMALMASAKSDRSTSTSLSLIASLRCEL